MSKGECFCCDAPVKDCECGSKETYTNDSHDDGPFCPYCGTMNDACDSDGVLYDERTEDYTCNECGEDFDVSISVSFAWTAVEKSKEEE